MRKLSFSLILKSNFLEYQDALEYSRILDHTRFEKAENWEKDLHKKWLNDVLRLWFKAIGIICFLEKELMH